MQRSELNPPNTSELRRGFWVSKYVKITAIVVIITIFLTLLGWMYNWYVGRTTIATSSETTKQAESNTTVSSNTKKTDLVEEKLSVAEVISKNEKYIVKVICQANDGDVQATGVIVGKDLEGNLIVLTNYHVIENLKKLPNNPPCGISSDNKDWTEYYYAEPIFWEEKISKEDMWLIDFAFLEVKVSPKIEHVNIDENGNETQGKQTENILSMDKFPNICDTNRLKIGEEVVILGFPSISNVDVPIIEFTSVFTATEGIISENITSTDYYFNTSAKIDSGNSGGGAFLRNSGCLAGIPTFVVKGNSDSMGKVLNARNIKREFLIKVLDKMSIYDEYISQD